MSESYNHILMLTTQIVTAQLRHNVVATAAVPGLIRSVFSVLLDIAGRSPYAASALVSEYVSAANQSGQQSHIVHNVYEHPTYGQTVFDDRLICMECGLTMKMLKRHLLTVHGMAPDDYRTKWNLPEEYPMVASTYAKLRSNLALQSGLGLKPDARADKRRSSR